MCSWITTMTTAGFWCLRPTFDYYKLGSRSIYIQLTWCSHSSRQAAVTDSTFHLKRKPECSLAEEGEVSGSAWTLRAARRHSDHRNRAEEIGPPDPDLHQWPGLGHRSALKLRPSVPAASCGSLAACFLKLGHADSKRHEASMEEEYLQTPDAKVQR